MDDTGAGGTPDGLKFESPEFFLPADDLGKFGIERILVRKHARPNRNAVIMGALLWDNENKYQYFVTSAELTQLEIGDGPLVI